MILRKYVKRPEDRISVHNTRDLQLSSIFTKKSMSDAHNNVLNHIESFSAINLYHNYVRNPTENMQEIYYVIKGRGELSIEGKKSRVGRGIAFLVPSHASISMRNIVSELGPLGLLVIKEQAPKSPRRDILIRNVQEVPYDDFDPPLHWCHKTKTLFDYQKDSLGKTHYVSIVYVDKNKHPEQHRHFPGHDEVWHSLKGKTRMAFREDVFVQNPGTSIFIPDNGETPHTSITSNSAAEFFFFMHHMALDNRILVTGSHGRIGRLVTDHLKDERGYQFLTEIDRDNPENPVNILYDDLVPYFKDIDTVIHLAANPDPFLDEKGAEKNIAMTRRVIDTCDNVGTVKRIVYASSINVYPYREIERIDRNTPLTPNTAFSPGGYYGRSKIESESMLEHYCVENNISLANLRLGWVSSNDKFPPYYEDKPHQRDLDVALKHDDLLKMIDKAIEYHGIGSYVCVSDRKGFIDENVLFPV